MAAETTLTKHGVKHMNGLIQLMYWGKIMCSRLVAGSTVSAVQCPSPWREMMRSNAIDGEFFGCKSKTGSQKCRIMSPDWKNQLKLFIVLCLFVDIGVLKSNQMTNATKRKLYNWELKGMIKRTLALLGPIIHTLIQFLFWLVSPDCIMNSGDIHVTVVTAARSLHHKASFLFTARISSGNHHGAVLWCLFHPTTATAE